METSRSTPCTAEKPVLIITIPTRCTNHRRHPRTLLRWNCGIWWKGTREYYNAIPSPFINTSSVVLANRFLIFFQTIVRILGVGDDRTGRRRTNYYSDADNEYQRCSRTHLKTFGFEFLKMTNSYFLCTLHIFRNISLLNFSAVQL